MQERLTREQEFYDDLVVDGSASRTLLDRFSYGFYDKGNKGRLWGPLWRSMDLNGANVLDYGCGNGEFSRILALKGARVVGVDISPKLIETARVSATSMGLNGSGPQFMVGDAHHTPFPDNTFDYVVGNGALHHLDLEKAYAEIARVLKPGGKALFMEPMYDHPVLRIIRLLTPNAHSADERPLSLNDMAKSKNWFRTYSHREHFLFSVCCAPVHLFGKRIALAVLGTGDRFDQLLMRLMPSLRRFGWLAMMEMQK
jgi:ubiquinone/menaquinone biosynthesis C-methylase UbiE